MGARTETPDALERESWARLPRLFSAPRRFFAGLEDESREAADARQEPLLAVASVAGISIFLSLAALEPPYGRYDDPGALNLLLQTILGGLLVGVCNLWLGGLLVYLGTRGLGAISGYRLARHVAGFATAPFILALVLVWPVRLALYGTDLFRAGGSDEGAGGDAFLAIDALLLIWALALALLGIRATQRWSHARSAAALGVGMLFAILVGTFVFAATR